MGNSLSDVRSVAALQGVVSCDSIHSAAKGSGVSVPAIIHLCYTIGALCKSWLFGAFRKRMGHVLARVDKAKVGDESNRVFVYSDTRTNFCFGFDIAPLGSDADAMCLVASRDITEACEMSRLAYARRVPGSFGRCRSEADTKSMIALRLTLFNLCNQTDGATPAMRAGLADRVWTAADIYAASIGMVAADLGQAPLPDRDMTGETFGRWRVVETLRQAGRKNPDWCLCRCSCGTVRKLNWKALRASESCGCALIEKLFGYSTTKLVRLWGVEVSVGQLHELTDINLVSLCARLRACPTVEMAAFGKLVETES